MKKLHLIIADTDVAYVESVSTYIRNSNEAAKIDLKLFSSRESLQRYLDSNGPCDILLISPPFLPFPEDPNRTTLLLDDDQMMVHVTDLPTVFKYQPMNRFLSEILSVYYEQHEKMAHFESGKPRTKVVSVYSATGGSGKTTLAVNFSKQLALQGNKVFYLNLELLHSTPLFFTSSDLRPSSQILYYVKSNPTQLLSKIETLKTFDPYAQVDYFDLPVCAEEMASLSQQETDSLISSLVSTENYDVLIIDLDASLHDRAKAALHCSDEILWLLNLDLQSFHKTSFLISDCETLFGNEANIREKTKFILNRYTGSLPKELMRYDLPIQYYLPYIPEWKNANQGSQMMVSSVFSEALYPILQKARGVAID